MERIIKPIFSRFTKKPLVSGLFVFFIVLFSTQFLSFREYQIRIIQEREIVNQKLIEARNSLDESIHDGIAAAEVLSILVEFIDPVKDFDSIAGRILSMNPKVDVIQYLDSTGTIVAIYPLEGNEKALGFNPLLDSANREELEETLRRKRIYFSGPQMLVQGGAGIIGRQPIYNEKGDFVGIAAVIIHLEDLMTELNLADLDSSKFGIHLSKLIPNQGSTGNFFEKLPETDLKNSHTINSFIPEGNWMLWVWGKDSFALKQTLPAIILRFLAAIILGILVWRLAKIPSILEQKVDEKSHELILANERFELATKATSDMIWDWDLVTQITYRSDQFKELLGYELNETTNASSFWEDLIHPDDYPRVIKNIAEFLNSDNSYWSQEFRIQKIDGSYLYVLDKGFAIRDSSGKAIRIIGATQDISLQKKAENDLIEANLKLGNANQELQAFASVASHDMKEPLRMISSFMSLLQTKYADTLDDKAQQYIRFAVDGAKRLTQMINDILEYSRIGFDPDMFEMISIKDLVEEVIKLKSDVISNSGVKFDIGPLPTIYTIRVPIKIVFQNLIGNAIKYITPGQEILITIQARELDDYWEFAVKDNGIGIDPQYLEQIFDLLKRLHPKSQYPGTGMGLSTCRKIVTQFGGKIWAESSPGNGSTFFFTLKKVSPTANSH